MIEQAIEGAHRHGRHCGICGQAPSDRPGFARWMIDRHIDSISLNPDSVLGVMQRLSKALGLRSIANLIRRICLANCRHAIEIGDDDLVVANGGSKLVFYAHQNMLDTTVS